MSPIPYIFVAKVCRNNVELEGLPSDSTQVFESGCSPRSCLEAFTKRVQVYNYHSAAPEHSFHTLGMALCVILRTLYGTADTQFYRSSRISASICTTVSVLSATSTHPFQVAAGEGERN